LLRAVRSEPAVVLDVTPNATVLAFTAGATLACVILFGLVPAFRVTRVDLASALRGHRSAGAGTGGGGRRRTSLTTLLVIAQVALSTILLIGSGLLVRSMSRLLDEDLGMDRDHLVVAHVATSRSRYTGTRLLVFQREALARVREVRGVDAASYSLGGPFSGGHSSGHVSVPGFVAQADSEGEISYDYIGPNYFHAIGARIVRGRDFAAADLDANAKVAAINATMARYYFRGRDPLGGTVISDGDSYTVVAVVGDVQYSDVRARPVRRMYIPDADTVDHPRSFELQIHVRGDPARYVAPIRQALLSLDRTVPVVLSPLAERVKHSLAQDALLMQVTTFFALLALTLAALGLYGVTSYASARRTSEFGLRTALGAESWRVAAMVLREALAMALCGVAIGVPLGAAATRLLRGTLYGVTPLDPESLGGTVLLLVLTTVLASYLPARRASRVSPLDALRAEQ
jgi:predicted permease